MRLTALCAAVILAAAAVALAAPPKTMSYQGVLKDDVGSPVPDATYRMEFTIYDSETTGNTLWSGSKHVAVTDGIFNVILGSDTPLDLPFDAPYWLGIAVEGEP
ncbi:MAG: collagen-like protein, partial [Candidatus Eisenbacteria bacterium]|nr:collagen-like protein [Candidatus Eisenbacteria bacterium]